MRGLLPGILLLLAGCTSQYSHIRAERFNGEVPGFGRVDAENILILQAPGRANSGQEIYEVNPEFWKYRPAGEEGQDEQ